MTQQYSLRWNNHQPNFISMFTSLLNTQTLVDVTLAAEGKHLQAHKVVLSACSTYFQALFVDNPSRHPIVILKDVTFADLRTMVDFMYYGEVNVTEEQLPQVLDTAKLLKIKGLTEMPDSTSLTRAQGSVPDFQSPGDSVESQRHSASPAVSPRNRQKRRRKSSTGSTSLNMVGEDNRNEETGQPLDVVRGDSITLSSLPQQRRLREYDERVENTQQTGEPHNLNVEPLGMDNNSMVIPQGGQWSMMEHTYPRYTNACIGGTGGLQPDPGMYNVINPHMDSEINEYGQGLGVTGPSPGPSCVTEQQTVQEPMPTPTKRRRTANPQSEENFQRALEAVRYGDLSSSQSVRFRRSKFFKRQGRVQPDEREVRRQMSEPAPLPTQPQLPPMPTLQKHESYPQYTPRPRRPEQEMGSFLIRAVAVVGRQTSTTTCTTTSYETTVTDSTAQTQRASHTPAVRLGPPLSCNFCWNTKDDSGRMIRRKTQYHCPECRTNLCIVPCFHEYHDGNESDAAASAR